MKLPKFIFDRVKVHNTSLGDNGAFPPEEDYPFDYKVLKDRMKYVVETFEKKFGKMKVEEACNLLQKRIEEAKKLEEPLKGQLENLCKKVIEEAFDVPTETVDLECKLVGGIKPKYGMRVMPEDSSLRNFDFNDLDDFDNMSKAILKRRFIDALVLGASYEFCDFTRFDDMLAEAVGDEMCVKLVDVYNDIKYTSDYLLFMKEEAISDKHPMQGSCVEVELGREGEQTKIHAQAINFMFLLMETARGFYELFASHGLPSDNKKAEYIIKQADILVAEPWDLRFGVSLWERISDVTYDGDKYKIIPYYFRSICEMTCDDFNKTMKEMLMNTVKGKELKAEIAKEAEHDYEMDSIEKTITMKSKEDDVIEDEYMSDGEIEGSMIEEDGDTPPSPPVNWRRLIQTCEGRDDLDFRDEQINDMQFQMHVVIKGIELPLSICDFKAEPRFVINRDLLQVHTIINEEYQHLGLGYKIHRRFVELYGNLYCGYGRMLNREEVISIFKRLDTEPNIKVEEVIGHFNRPIGIKAELIQH
jgi:hypothetical protein